MPKIVCREAAMDGISKQIWQDVNRQGVCWLHLDDPVKDCLLNPLAFARHMIGQDPKRVDVYPVRPVKHAVNYLGTNIEAKFHVDNDVYMMPPGLQMFVCMRQAESGGETFSIDTWALLKQIKARDKALFHQLFHAPRVMPFADGDRYGPTFAMNDGNLVCYHVPQPFPADEVGWKFQKWVDRAPRICLRLKPDDVLISNNHRMLHSRSAFVGPDRYLIRFTIWPRKRMDAPAIYRAPAQAFFTKAKRALAKEPLWIHRRLGLASTPMTKQMYFYSSDIPFSAIRSEKQLRALEQAFRKLESLA